MPVPSFRSITTLLALLVSTSAADLVTVTLSSTLTICPTPPPPPPPCPTPAAGESTALATPAGQVSGLGSGGSIVGGGRSGGGGGGNSAVLPTYASTLPGSSLSSAVSQSSISGWNTTTGFQTSVTPTALSGSSTTSPTVSSSAPACTDYWLQITKHQGLAPYAASGYKVFRNVLDYGATGDGVTDDTDAINLAISDGGRCAPGTCSSSTTTPAIVYFPPGTYLVSSPIIDYYYTQIIGNPGCLPVIKASASFNNRWVIDGDQYQASGDLGWGSTNVFWRQIRNFVIDLTEAPSTLLVAGIHWPTGQATSLQNIVFKMSTAAGTQQQGLFIESGSGGVIGDLVFYGGAQGLQVGNQQFTMTNLTFFNSGTAIQQLWDWGWTYKGISINNCGIGLDLTAVDQTQLSVGGVVLIDSDITNTPVGISYGNTAASGPPASNNIILENVRLNNVDVAIQGPGKTIVLAGSAGASTISAWGRGNSYTPTGPTAFQGAITPNARPAGLVSGTDFYERSKPQYENIPVTQFVSIRDAGAVGDGVTDDTAAINAALAAAATAGKIVFFDFGVYVVTGTVFVPAGSKIVGETYPVILSSGSFFADLASPKPVVQVGLSGQTGQVEWSDMIISTRGAQAGAILIEWNLASTTTPSGMWDVHTRIGGFTGSNLDVATCPKTPTVVVDSTNLATNCIAAFMSMHITASASGLYVLGAWFWVSDHFVDDPDLTQITVYAGRGLLVEGVGDIWLSGTAVEHHVLYEYQFYGTQKIAMGQLQTETAYYQPNPDALIPFPADASFHDPVMAAGSSGWGLLVVDSSDLLIYGAGLYSFFSNNNVTCSNQGNGEACQARIFSVENSTISVYNLNTVGATSMITVDGTDVAVYSDNLDGFVDSIALFRS